MQNTENVIKFPTRRRHKGGFTPVPHDLLDAVVSGKFNAPQMRVLLAVVRLTLGWQKERDRLRLVDIAEVAGMKVPNVSKALKALEEMGALEVVYTRQGRIIGIIDDYAPFLENEGYPTDNKEATTYPTDNLQVIPQATPSYIDKESIKDRGEGACAPAPAGDAEANAESKTKPRPAKQTFDAFVADCKAKGEKPIPEDHPAFAFAADAGIPVQWLRVAWVEFGRRYRGTDKKYTGARGWRQAFNNAVRENWMRVWYATESGEVRLTSQGLLALKALEAKEREVQA